MKKEYWKYLKVAILAYFAIVIFCFGSKIFSYFLGSKYPWLFIATDGDWMQFIGTLIAMIGAISVSQRQMYDQLKIDSRLQKEQIDEERKIESSFMYKKMMLEKYGEIFFPLQKMMTLLLSMDHDIFKLKTKELTTRQTDIYQFRHISNTYNQFEIEHREVQKVNCFFSGEIALLFQQIAIENPHAGTIMDAIKFALQISDMNNDLSGFELAIRTGELDLNQLHISICKIKDNYNRIFILINQEMQTVINLLKEADNEIPLQNNR